VFLYGVCTDAAVNHPGAGFTNLSVRIKKAALL